VYDGEKEKYWVTVCLLPRHRDGLSTASKMLPFIVPVATQVLRPAD